MVRFSVVLLILVGCGDAMDPPGPTPPGPLVNLSDWTATEFDADPFLEFWSQQIRCTESDHGPETLGGIEGIR